MSSHGDNHPRLPIFKVSRSGTSQARFQVDPPKLADFGLGLPLPQEILTLNAWLASTSAFRTHWRDDTIWRGTPGYTPPVSNPNPSVHTESYFFVGTDLARC